MLARTMVRWTRAAPNASAPDDCERDRFETRRMNRARPGYQRTTPRDTRRSLGPGMMPGPRRVQGRFSVQWTKVVRRDSSVPLPLASLTRTWVITITPRLLLANAAFAGFVNFARSWLVPAL